MSISIIEDDRFYMIFFNRLDDYESLEEIATVLIENLNVNVKKKIDGPDSRIWFLEIKQEEILLINNDPYGNFLRAELSTSKEMLKMILPQLNELFR